MDGTGKIKKREVNYPMKTVLYTQRVEIVKSYGERRDCADQNIPGFIEACGYLPVPIPNIQAVAAKMIEQLRPAGIILTGGNSLVKYGGDAPERDETEKSILDLAIEKNIPVYGFCRGMQMILDYFGCELQNVTGHVAVRHKINGKIGDTEVNSYHNQACLNVNKPLEILARTEDGVIEAVCSTDHKILATMWHPERENPYRKDDITRIQNLFGRED
jgi:putative glutamine amidotransferase